MKITDRPSGNYDQRAADTPVDILMLHYTGMRSAEEALDRMCDRAAKVSAHYCVDEDGTIVRLVDESHRAWHAGVASWRGETDVNGRSIGIEIVNPGHEFGYRPFPEVQMRAVEELCQDILARWPIPARNVVGHSDVAPERKTDPGELFDWPRLARNGIGLVPQPLRGGDEPLSEGQSGQRVENMQDKLRAYGYGISPDGAFGAHTAHVVAAFQRHFRPGRVDGVADGETLALLDGLLQMVSIDGH